MQAFLLLCVIHQSLQLALELRVGLCPSVHHFGGRYRAQEQSSADQVPKDGVKLIAIPSIEAPYSIRGGIEVPRLMR